MYVTIKDHKEGFHNKISCRLVNRFRSTILEKNKVNQWKNTSSVLEWYRNIKPKDQRSFVVFDIESFYRSILTKLFDEALSFEKLYYDFTSAKLYYDFTSDELEVIMHSRETLSFWQNSTWVKKRALKILTYQSDVMLAQKYVNW